MPDFGGVDIAVEKKRIAADTVCCPLVSAKGQPDLVRWEPLAVGSAVVESADKRPLAVPKVPAAEPDRLLHWGPKTIRTGRIVPKRW